MEGGILQSDGMQERQSCTEFGISPEASATQWAHGNVTAYRALSFSQIYCVLLLRVIGLALSMTVCADVCVVCVVCVHAHSHTHTHTHTHCPRTKSRRAGHTAAPCDGPGVWSLGHTAVSCVATDDNDVEGAQRCGKESRKEAWRPQSLPWLWLLPL